ncbi:MAG: flagellar biosynthesis anti-sigma factor FlgM [Gammaproteobacteria bacterium]|nr:flagellar biosynthesis anti-sigma factor FlgM [Gammaproteobacteria bacterium]
MPIEMTGPLSAQQNRNSTEEAKAVSVGRTQPTAAQQDNGRPSSADTVTVTDIANQLSALDKKLQNVPVVDVQRIEQIRNAIDSGSYKIDPEQTADKLVEFELAMDG